MNPFVPQGPPPDLTGMQGIAERVGHDKGKGSSAAFILEPDHLVDAVGVLFDHGYFLEDITGVDVEEGILLVYHFDRYDVHGRVVLRLTVPHGLKKAPSIAGIFSGADWHERECFDFFGVEFEGHPAMKPLFLPDDLGVHPLLKEKGRKSLHHLLPLQHLVEDKT